MKRISELLHKKVYNKENVCLGRIYNIKLHLTYKGKSLDHIEVVSLLYGQKSFWERLGFIERKPKEVLWKDVRSTRKDRIVL